MQYIVTHEFRILAQSQTIILQIRTKIPTLEVDEGQDTAATLETRNQANESTRPFKYS